jgi:hypothetical protein
MSMIYLPLEIAGIGGVTLRSGESRLQGFIQIFFVDQAIAVSIHAVIRQMQLRG